MPYFFDPHNWPVQWIWGFFAAFGGGARYLNMYLNTGKFLWTNFIANILISGFSGFMFALIGKSLGVSQELLFVSAGVGGFMGHNALEWASVFIIKRFKI